MTAAAVTADHVYVYGVARAASFNPLASAALEGVVPGRPVELLPFGGLAAIVSACPAESAVPEAAAGGSEWARSRAVAHHQVLAELSGRFPLVPSKFGTVLRDFDSLAAFMEQYAPALEETLDQVAGCREWGLKLTADPKLAREAAQSAPSLAPLREELASASQGKAFFIRKKMKSAVEAEAQQMLASQAVEVHQALDAKARRSASVRICSSSSSGGANAQIMLLDAAYLVETAEEAEFHAALDAVLAPLAALGLNGRLTGPWPPYNFVSLPSGKTAHV
jgi:Gas vesicle synthesis protein GvpL/GvpF